MLVIFGGGDGDDDDEFVSDEAFSLSRMSGTASVVERRGNSFANFTSLYEIVRFDDSLLEHLFAPFFPLTYSAALFFSFLLAENFVFFNARLFFDIRVTS